MGVRVEATPDRTPVRRHRQEPVGWLDADGNLRDNNLRSESNKKKQMDEVAGVWLRRSACRVVSD